MKLLIDMNLSPDWVEVLAAERIDAIHWSKVGNAEIENHEEDIKLSTLEAPNEKTEY